MAQQSERRTFYYKLDDPNNLNMVSDENVHSIDWNRDFEMVDVIAYIQNGEILSFSIIYNIRPMELEIGAVSTVPKYRGRGYCTACTAYAAKQILGQGRIASITTMSDNYAMQKVAEKLHFTKITDPATPR